MTILADAIALPRGPLDGRLFVPHVDELALSQRVIRRPGPPPSKQRRQPPRSVPMTPPLAKTPPAPPQPPPIIEQQSSSRKVDSANDNPPAAPRTGTLLTVFVSSAVAISLFGILVCGLLALAKHNGYFTDTSASVSDVAAQPIAALAEQPPIINVIQPASVSDSRSDAFGQDAPTMEESQAAASLLEDRYYHLQTDDEGNVVGVRMTDDDHNKRFGPDIDEVQALTKLRHLQRLDLGNTLASVAVPIANRHPSVEVLVLKQQSDTDSLLKLERLKELHLTNSSVDAAKLARRGIKVVEVAGR